VKPRLLVISPVHPPDDPRIRHKLIKTLQDDWSITFAGTGRGPVDQEGLRWLELAGGRIRRGLRSGWLLLRSGYDVASLHDPEMLPVALVATLLHRTIVFDVHENIPAQLRSKAWIPGPLRHPLAWIAGRLLRLAEKRMHITLAEAGYSDLFANPHPVFPNYLAGQPPSPRDVDPEIGVVYLGDVTEARGLELAVDAVGAAGADAMTIMGRCSPEFRSRLNALADKRGLRLEIRGFVTPDNALQIASGGSIGLSPLLNTANYANSLPTKVLEYLAVGIPTVASDLPGTRAVVGDKPGVLLVAPGDKEAWEVAIRRSLNDAELRTAARDGAAAISKDYVWPGDEVRRFYKDLLPS
jgi:glycosyltransferase involved in cell wall biosynthesis